MTPEMTFEEAVEDTKKFLKLNLHDSAYLSDSKNFYKLKGCIEISDNLAKLLEESKSDAAAHRALRYGLAAILNDQIYRGGEAPPDKAMDWLVKYLCDEARPPGGRLGSHEKINKKMLIYNAVKRLETPERRIFRNDETRPKESCCDIVAAALNELRATTVDLKDFRKAPSDWKGVKDIYIEIRPYAEV